MPKDYTIAIIGGGIGGLCLSAVIGKYDPSITINIYEKRAVIEAWPNQIAIWKRPWQVLEDIGLEDELLKRNIPVPKDREVNGPIFRMSGLQTEGYDFHRHMMPYNPSSIPRPLLSEILAAKLPSSCTVFSSKKLLRYDSNGDGPIILHFQDGTTAQADVLIGADGVNSATRATLFQSLASETKDAALKEEYLKCTRPLFSGQLAYRCDSPLDKIKAANPNHAGLGAPKIWCGNDQHIVTYAGGGKMAIFIVINEPSGRKDGPYEGPWVADVPPEEVKKRFENWEPDVRIMIEHIQKPSRWAMHETNPLPCSVHGKVALLGDSIHAMLPHQGVGGGEVIEDAHLLGRLLAHPKVRLEHISEIFEIFEAIRLPRSQLAARRTRENGLMYDFRHPDFPFHAGSSKEDLEKLGKTISDSFKWLGEGSVMDDWKKAEEVLDKVVN